MKLSDFDYKLPQDLIAQEPLPQRDQSRMMVLDRKTGHIDHALFRDLPAFLDRGDVLALNNSRVIPARVWGNKNDTSIEFLFLKEMNGSSWQVLCRPARKVRKGDRIFFSNHLVGEVIQTSTSGLRTLHFPHHDVLAELKKIGFAPLPPYIKRKKEDLPLKTLDLQRYQTVFAHKRGSIAAPTAGLHFTPDILDFIRSQGVKVTAITLNVGLATFQPVRVSVVEDHKMLEEDFHISSKAAKTINQSQDHKRSLTAVGTTTVRALESAAEQGRIRSGHYSTKLFIYPGYKFQIIDRLLTNFHLPQSTLLVLTSAFAGREFILKAYREAVRQRYRFYSYGDCMLIL